MSVIWFSFFKFPFKEWLTVMWFYIVVLHLGCIILTIFIFHQGRSLFPELQQSWKLFGEKQPSCAKKKKKPYNHSFLRKWQWVAQMAMKLPPHIFNSALSLFLRTLESKLDYFRMQQVIEISCLSKWGGLCSSFTSIHKDCTQWNSV